ncbi:MAG: PspA/IM30 family protein [Gammaproteobacteria bacterium]|nr:PspA/IM30 family protein [Gammaproteobacteria bacterium]MCF6229199.1 PspA/IM30 family protein [Gammaproteobacteria bacterium]
MKELLANRVGRIVSGSLNALIDAVENAAPEAVMQESIREIDSAIDEVRAELGRTVASKHLANSRLVEEHRKHAALAEKIALAVNEACDDLAEVAIASQLDIEAQIPVLEGTIAERSTQEKELESYIAALQAKKREMQAELKQFRVMQQQADAVGTAGKATATESRIEKNVEKASAAFSRVMESSTGLSNGPAAHSHHAAQLAELDKMAHKNRVQERLAAIKKNNPADSR